MPLPTNRPRDAHAHILLHGRALSMPSLARCMTRAQGLATISEAARGVQPGRWLVACSMRSEGWDDPRPPTRVELDRECPSSPCCVWSFDQHTIVANTRALESAGIRRGTPNPAGGIIVRDDRGDPTGLLLESAAMLLWRAVPEPTAAESERYVRAGVDHLASLGFAEVHELHAPAVLGPALARLADSGGLAMRVRLYAPFARIEEEIEAARHYTRDLVTLDGAKIFVDGTLNARTAWMLEPYSDPIASHPRGTPMMSAHEVEEAIRRVDRLGLPLAAHAIGDAARLIVHGDADVMIAGGAHTMIHPLGVTGFNRLTALSTRNDNPCGASRPFSADRGGFVLGEGAGIVIIEALPHALARGATILAEITGYGSSADAYRITDIHPDGRGAAVAMRMALDDAGVKPTDIDYISAHGTGTKENDSTETMAIKRVFGDDAKKVPVSSVKSMLGHLIAAAGAVELITCVLAIRDQMLPPTINLQNPDPECDLDYVPNVARKARVEVCLSNSFGFGGQNDTLVVRRWNGA